MSPPTGYKEPPTKGVRLCPMIAENKVTMQWKLQQKKTPWEKMAGGLRRRHKKGNCDAQCVLSIDVTGPFPPCEGTKFIYALVAVYSEGVGENLPFVQGLRRKAQEDVAHALLKIVKRNYMAV